jgi:hypothetical protein
MLLRGNGFSSKVAQVLEAGFLLRLVVGIAKSWEIFAVFQAASLPKVEVKPLLSSVKVFDRVADLVISPWGGRSTLRMRMP